MEFSGLRNFYYSCNFAWQIFTAKALQITNTRGVPAYKLLKDFYRVKLNNETVFPNDVMKH